MVMIGVSLPFISQAELVSNPIISLSNAAEWYAEGDNRVSQNLAYAQQAGLDGEENELFFETFPNVALSKTYNTNQQTPGSAGTMTAMMSGVKTKAGIIGANQNTIRGDCSSQAGNGVYSVLDYAEVVDILPA